jgi:hypothetical protein
LRWRTASKEGLVEGGGKIGAAEMVEHMDDLGGSDAVDGEWWEIVFGEELCVGGFLAVQGSATREFCEKKKLIGVKDVVRMAVEVAIEESGKLGDADFVAGFFASFASCSDGRRLANIGPTPGQRPAAILKFADKENALIPKGSDANINFWRGITRLLGKKIVEESGGGQSCASGHHFRGNTPDLVIALDIELVLAISETGLRDSLESARPCEPLWNGHRDILAASEAANKSRGLQVCSRIRNADKKSNGRELAYYEWER